MWNFGQSDLINCGQHKDESLGERLCAEVGAAIDKNGMDIEALKKAKLEDHSSLFEICGKTSPETSRCNRI